MTRYKLLRENERKVLQTTTKFLSKSNRPSSVSESSKRINEASIMKPDVEIGEKFRYKGGKFSFLDKKGYQDGDIFFASKTKQKVDYQAGKGSLKRTLTSERTGESFTFGGDVSSYKSFFSHATKDGSTPPKGEDWESLIVVAYNGKKEGKEWKRAEKFWETYENQAKVVAKKLSQVVSAKQIQQLGSSTAALNPVWKQWGGEDNTPKTDILAGEEHISLKKAGGSQLLSGGPKEIIATFKAATQMMSEDVAEPVFKFIDSVQEKMGKVAYNDTATNIDKLATDMGAGKKLTPDQLKAVEEKQRLDVNHAELTAGLTEIFQDFEFKKIFCFEAATGTTKFSDGNAIANILVEFNPEKGEITKNLKISSKEDAAILAQNNKFYFAFKSSGVKPYSSLRTSQLSKKALKNLESGQVTETLSEIVIDEIRKSNTNLYESFSKLVNESKGSINEFEMLSKLVDKVKNFPKNVADKVKEIYTSVMERVKKAFDAIKKLGKKMIETLMYFLGIEIEKIDITSTGPFPLVLSGAEE